MVPCILFEDEHLLVVNKPAGLNTHAPSPYSGEGIYDWLRHREPRWAGLAIIHRLDKETSGVLVFSKTTLANRSLTEQFSGRSVRKTYVLLTDRHPPARPMRVKSCLTRSGERYVSRPVHASGNLGETLFQPARDIDDPKYLQAAQPGLFLVAAEPLTGRTHQIRVHAADSGFPILGDTLYGGTLANRLFLHAQEIRFAHPASGETMEFRAPTDFSRDKSAAMREAIINPRETDAFRLVHGTSDGATDWFVDQLGPWLLSQAETPLNPARSQALSALAGRCGATGCYHKILNRQVRRTSAPEVSPARVAGGQAPDRFLVRENGLVFELSLQEGYSVGLFLDQRDNRRRLLTGHIAAGFAPLQPGCDLLNTFAYTCGFSVAAARFGARTTSLDLSKKYLEWGRRNFQHNNLDPARHEFIYGDVFDWLRRLDKKRRRFDTLLLDPPTFSQSKASGVFRADRDYGRLVKTALPLLKENGLLFASCNTAGWAPEEFLHAVQSAVVSAGRKIQRLHYAPQPPDFPVSRAEPAYLKTAWLQIA